MISASAALIAHLEGSTLSLATCWRVTRRDGLVLRFTDHDRNLTISGETFLASLSYERSALAWRADLSVAQAELRAILDSASITERDIRAGLWDGAAVAIFVVNWSDLSQGILRRARGWLGELVIGENGAVRAELRGLAQPLQAPVGSVYQPTCRADLGDAKCKIPLRPPLWAASTAYGLGAFVRADLGGGAYASSYDEGGAIFECIQAGTSGASPPVWLTGAPFGDGGIIWQPRAAWTRPATVSSVTGSSVLVLVADGIEAYADGWFQRGVAVWETGANAGAVAEIVGWVQASRTLSLLSPPPFAPAPGDVLRVQPGCDKLRATCRDKFANADNHRGEPTLPGLAAVLETPVTA